MQFHLSVIRNKNWVRFYIPVLSRDGERVGSDEWEVSMSSEGQLVPIRHIILQPNKMRSLC